MSQARETDQALLLADLSGYTALTETHGALQASEIIERFGQLAEASLEPGVAIVDRVGDEVLCAAVDTLAVVRTALRLRSMVMSEPDFPTVRVGIHRGPVLARSGKLFGAPLNLAARITGRASGGHCFPRAHLPILLAGLRAIVRRSARTVCRTGWRLTPVTAQYIPPLRFHFLTRFYDGLVRWTTREAVFKEALLAQLGQAPGERLLDVGCGTATLSVALARRFPEARVVGIDADGAALGIARAKAAGAHVRLDLEQAFADRMPFPSGSFDAAVSSLFFHHLTRDAKAGALAEIFRVLRPGGALHVADWGRPANLALRAAFLLVQALDGRETTRDSVAGVLPEIMSRAGFVEVRHTRNFATALGTMALYSSTKPTS